MEICYLLIDNDGPVMGRASSMYRIILHIRMSKINNYASSPTQRDKLNPVAASLQALYEKYTDPCDSCGIDRYTLLIPVSASSN